MVVCLSGYPLMGASSDDRVVVVPNMAHMKSTTGHAGDVLVTRDPSLIDAISATALALGTPMVVTADRDELRVLWPSAAVALVGADMASKVASLESRAGPTWVVGQPDSALLAASAQLSAPALALPQSSAQLAEVLSRRPEPEPASSVVALVGGSGGLGTSSVTVALSVVAASGGRRVAVVELAEAGGGLDLLLGVESMPGLRWHELANATGELGGLADQLVSVDGVSLLAMSRGSRTEPTAAAVSAVLRSLRRTEDLIVVDAGDGRRLPWLTDAQPVLLAAADVRGVAAARMVAEQHDLVRAQLVVRTGPGSTLPSEAVADALGLPLLGTIRHDPAVPRLAGAGAGIASRPARRFRRDVAKLVQGVAR